MPSVWRLISACALVVAAASAFIPTRTDAWLGRVRSTSRARPPISSRHGDRPPRPRASDNDDDPFSHVDDPFSDVDDPFSDIVDPFSDIVDPFSDVDDPLSDPFSEDVLRPSTDDEYANDADDDWIDDAEGGATDGDDDAYKYDDDSSRSTSSSASLDLQGLDAAFWAELNATVYDGGVAPAELARFEAFCEVREATEE